MRRCVAHLRATLGVSERRACLLLGQPRSTQRFRYKARNDDSAMVRRVIDIAHAHPRLGYRRAWMQLGGQASGTSLKQFYRLWKEHVARNRARA